jgi:hypothetical protein
MNYKIEDPLVLQVLKNARELEAKNLQEAIPMIEEKANPDDELITHYTNEKGERVKLKAPYSVNTLRSLFGPTDADIAELDALIEEKAKHEDCDGMCCRPWTT